MGQSKHIDQDADGAEKDIESTPCSSTAGPSRRAPTRAW